MKKANDEVEDNDNNKDDNNDKGIMILIWYDASACMVKVFVGRLFSICGWNVRIEFLIIWYTKMDLQPGEIKIHLQREELTTQPTVGRLGGVRDLKGQNMIMEFFGPIGLIDT